jgi:hypothetical protein
MDKKISDKVRANTSASSNEKIDQMILTNIESSLGLDDAKLSSLIHKLDEESDIEKVLEMNASLFAFIGVLLGAFVNIYWLILPGLILPFLFLHAIQGWCPPIPILRSMKIRTRKEIDLEKYALKIIRNDFMGIDKEKGGKAIFSAVKK